MVQLVDLLDVQLRNLTPGGKDSAARSLNKVRNATAGWKPDLIYIWPSANRSTPLNGVDSLGACLIS